MRVQQYSGPVMAKGLEDTAFYRYNRFVALNEVGGQPDRFGVGLAAFHRTNAQRAEHWPHAMLCTSTHDTKRGEDTRARLAVLSEMPDEWARQVQAWSRLLRARRGDVEGTAPPYPNDEYLFYQLLLGAWPAELTGVENPEPDLLRAFSQRLEGAMVKSMREAKLRSTWASPNLEYEEAVLGFVRDAVDVSRPNAFLGAFLPFQEKVARLGVRNSLVQTALKLTLPGMPDLYQGAELWDLSLVDPDNRRPVDYQTRTELLEEIERALEKNPLTAMLDMLENWQDGRIKLAIIATLLAYRRKHPQLFSRAGYQPLNATGSRSDQICAFVRRVGEDALIVVASRFPARCEDDRNWSETEIEWPQTAGSAAAVWRDLLSRRVVEPRGSSLEVAAILHEIQVAVMVPENA
jgi:(1->4)-alpha-D-glucan 1-alpha-D-glucosylmutase